LRTTPSGGRYSKNLSGKVQLRLRGGRRPDPLREKLRACPERKCGFQAGLGAFYKRISDRVFSPMQKEKRGQFEKRPLSSSDERPDIQQKSEQAAQKNKKDLTSIVPTYGSRQRELHRGTPISPNPLNWAWSKKCEPRIPGKKYREESITVFRVGGWARWPKGSIISISINSGNRRSLTREKSRAER